MDYYLLFSKFEPNEGSFSVQEPWNLVLDYSHLQLKLLQSKGRFHVDKCYDARGMSDFLKIGLGKLASPKVQQIFFEQGFSGIQFLPVEIENHTLIPGYAFMNPIAHYDLLDVEASEAEDFCDTRQGYSDVFEEIIDKDKFDKADIQHDCFTLSNYQDPYFVSERVKHALEAANITGIEFIPMEFS